MICVDISRIQVGLHGISAQVVEEATAGLESELSRRLGTFPGGYSDLAAIDIGELAIGPIHSSTVLDAAALRGIIADRLVDAVRSQLANRHSRGLAGADSMSGGV